MGLEDLKQLKNLPKENRLVGAWILLVEKVVPIKQQQKVLARSQWLYLKLTPKTKFTYINIAFFILFPYSIWLFVKTKGYLDRNRKQMMVRRREIEAEMRGVLEEEKQSGIAMPFGLDVTGPWVNAKADFLDGYRQWQKRRALKND